MKKRCLLQLGILITILLTLQMVMANEIENISININSPSVIRLGYDSMARITLINMNDDSNIILNKISILSSNRTIKEKEFNKIIPSLKNEILRLRELEKQHEELCESLDLWGEHRDLSLKIKKETFSTSFDLNLHDFEFSSEDKRVITILFKFEFTYNNQRYYITKQHSTILSEPLPKANDLVLTKNSLRADPQSEMFAKGALPNKPLYWYAGDQHVHSRYGETAYETPDPLLEMVNASIAQDLDWVIFTDHSYAFYNDEESWEDGKTACNSASTDAFKCIYNQEMSVNAPGLCDQAHYLVYPYLNEDIDYIDGTCGLTDCFCRDPQIIINDVSSAGGMGFIAHPYSGWWGWEQLWSSTTNYTGLEIWNNEWDEGDAKTFYNPSTSAVDSWQEFLQIETDPSDGFTVGIGNSDAHYIENVGKTFTYCYMQSLTNRNILDALMGGHCVASDGPLTTFTIQGEIIGEVVDICSGNNTLQVDAYSNSEFGTLDKVKVYIRNPLLNDPTKTVPLSDYTKSVNISINIPVIACLGFECPKQYVYLQLETNEGIDQERHKAITNPIWVNVHHENFDEDEICDYYDEDDDNDLVLDVDEEEGCEFDIDCDDDTYNDTIDLFPKDPTEWLDNDVDGIGDNADEDDDNDAVLDLNDSCSFTYGQDYEQGCPDLVPPEVTLNLSSSLVLGNEALTITCEHNDTDPNPIHNLIITKPSNKTVELNCSTAVFNETDEEGEYQVYFEAIDGGNNSASITETFYVDSCIPNLVQINETCQNDDTFVSWFNDTNKCYEQTGLGSDKSPENETYSCDYCQEDITELYTNWSSCLSDSTQTRIKYYVDNNYQDCCAVTGLESDCHINNEEHQNITEIQSCDYCNPNLSEEIIFVNVTKLASVTNGISSLKWSSDGTKLLFSTINNVGKTLTMQIVNVTDGSLETIEIDCSANIYGCFHPTWSDDGSRIVFAEYQDPSITLNYHIKYVNVDNPSNLIPTALPGVVPAFSPDNSKIAYYRHVGTQTEYLGADVYVGQNKINTDTSRLIGGVNIGQNHIWSPDGNKVAYFGGSISKGMFVKNLVTGEIIKVNGTNNYYPKIFSPNSEIYYNGSYLHPSWSYTNKEMLYYKGGSTIYLIYPYALKEIPIPSVTIGQATYLTGFPGKFAEWSPNEFSFAFVYNKNEIWLANFREKECAPEETYCGDGIANGGETCSSCPADVGVCPLVDDGGGGGGGGGSSGSFTTTSSTETNVTSNSTTTPTPTDETTEDIVDETLEGEPAGITGATIGTAVKRYILPVLIFIVVIIGAWGGVWLWRKKRNKDDIIYAPKESSNKIDN